MPYLTESGKTPAIIANIRFKKKLRLTSLDNSGKGVKWNYPEAADLSEDESVAEVTTRANIAVWLVARGNKSYASREGLAGKDWI